MRPLHAMRLPYFLLTVPAMRMVRLIGASLAVIGVFAFCVSPASGAGQQDDGAILFQKHCIGCHPNELKTITYEGLLTYVRTPPVGMPAFSERKLSDRDVRAIRKHLDQTLSIGRKGPQLEASLAGKRSGSGEGGTIKHASATSPSETKHTHRTLKERKAWLRGFGTH